MLFNCLSIVRLAVTEIFFTSIASANLFGHNVYCFWPSNDLLLSFFVSFWRSSPEKVPIPSFLLSYPCRSPTNFFGEVFFGFSVVKGMCHQSIRQRTKKNGRQPKSSQNKLFTKTPIRTVTTTIVYPVTKYTLSHIPSVLSLLTTTTRWSGVFAQKKLFCFFFIPPRSTFRTRCYIVTYLFHSLETYKTENIHPQGPPPEFIVTQSQDWIVRSLTLLGPLTALASTTTALIEAQRCDKYSRFQ